MKNKRQIVILCLVSLVIVIPLAHGAFTSTKISSELMTQINSDYSKEIVVLFTAQPGEDLEKLAEKVARNGGTITGKYPVGNVVVAKMRSRGITTVAAEPEVLNAWPRKIYHTMLDESVPQIKASAMWDAGYNGSGVKIAIIDTGIDKNHPMLSGRVISEAVFTGEASAHDGNSHGTHVAGIAAGNGLLKGVAPGALLMNAKALNNTGNGYNDWIIAAINWAVDPDGNSSTDDGADVISISLGGIGGTDDPLNNAVKDAISRGVVVVVASGNCGSAGYCPGNFVGVTSPGNTEEAITVGAVDENDNWASFSSGHDFGTYIKPDIVAPGVRINSSLPDGRYAAYSGTSMATPHVAGAAALLLQYNPLLNHSDIKYIIEKTARPSGPPGKDTKYGSGVLSIDRFMVPSIDRFVKYRTYTSEFVNQNEPIPIMVNVTIYGVINVSVTVRSPSSASYDIRMSNVSANGWKGVFTDTFELGRYTLQFQAMDITGKSESFNETVAVIPSQSAYGEITAVYTPVTTNYTNVTPFNVTFANRWNSLMSAIIEMQILYNNSLMASEKISIELLPLEERNFTFNFTSRKLGVNLIRIIATSPAGYDMEERLIDVIDDAAPEVHEVIFKKKIVLNEPFMAELIVSDASIVNATTTFSGSELPMTFAYAIAEEYHLKSLFVPDILGEQSFTLKVCDKQNLCTNYSSSFEVAQCDKPQLLVVSDNDINNYTGTFLETLHDDYCPALWDTSFGLPQTTHLNSFRGIAWLVGTGTGLHPDTNRILSAYRGKLYLQGDTVASMNRYDDVLRNVLRAEFYGELPVNNTSIYTTYPHPVLDDFETLTINRSTSNPITVRPVDEGIALASFGDSSAIIASENENKIIFSTFTAASLIDKSDIFIHNVAQWLSEDTDFDIRITNATMPRLVEGDNEITATLAFDGLIDSHETNVSYFVDGRLQGTIRIPIHSNTTSFVVRPAFIHGIHELRLFANYDLAVKEKKYLNNGIALNISVAPIKPDLDIKDIDYTYANGVLNLSAVVSNIGGTDANSSLDFIVDNEIVASFNVKISKGEDMVLSRSVTKSAGLYIARVVADGINAVDEADESNNEYSEKLYLCGKQRVLLVNDSDTRRYSTEMPSSAHLFESALKSDGYCVEVNDGAIHANGTYDLIVWSAGDYWDTTIDANDITFLQQYDRILLEGSEIAYDHGSNEFMRTKMHAEFQSDLLLDNDTVLVLSEHPLFENITNLTISKDMSPYPDSVTSLDGEAIANWSHGGAAIILFNDSQHRTAYFSFSADGIEDNATRNTLIANTMEWLLYNNPPVLYGLSNITVKETEVVAIQANATDLDNDELIFSTNDSRFIQISNGTFVWRTTYSDAGVYAVEVSVSDGFNTVSQTILVTVANVNRFPVIDPIPNITVHETELVEVIPHAADHDNDTILFFYSPPLNASGMWQTDYDDAGEYNVTVTASDGIDNVTYTIQITVINVNLPPVLDLIHNMTLNEGQTVLVLPNASDPDNDSLTFFFSMPLNASGMWKTNYSSSGTYQVSVTASDGVDNVTGSFYIDVLNVNRMPHIFTLDEVEVNEGARLFLMRSEIKWTSNGELSEDDMQPIPAVCVDAMPNSSIVCAVIYDLDNENNVTNDDNNLTLTFSYPFNSTGYWQTDYSSAGRYNITITVTDGELADWRDVVIIVNNVNMPPVINTLIPNGSITINEGSSQLFEVVASDADGDNLVYDWMLNSLVVSTTNTFNLTADYDSAGEYLLTVAVSDGVNTAYGRINVTIIDVDRSPVLDFIGDKQVRENSSLNFSVSGSDPDNDVLSFYVVGLPVGADFSDNVFSWTPDFSQSGNYTLTFVVSDGIVNDSEVITVEVFNFNRPPVMDFISDKAVMENETLSFVVSGSDPDNDSLSFYVVGLPAGAVFSGNVFSWTPDFSQAGNYSVVFLVSDGESNISSVIALEIGNKNRPPEVAPLLEINAHEGETISINVSAADPDGDNLEFNYSSLFNSSGGWSTDYASSGSYQANVTVSDGIDSITQLVQVNVLNVNRRPSLILPQNSGELSINEGDLIWFAAVQFNLTESSGSQPLGSRQTSACEPFLTGNVTLKYVCVLVSDLDNENSVVNDDNNLTPIFSSPLNSTGHWQTDYSSAGRYNITITVNDGELADLANVVVIVDAVNRPPEIGALVPNGTVSVSEGSSQLFDVIASDADSDNLTYTWTLGSRVVSVASYFYLAPDYDSAGDYLLTVSVSDGLNITYGEVNVTIININRPPSLIVSPLVKSVFGGELAEFTLFGEDSDNDELYYFTNDSRFEQSGNVFRWLTAEGDLGNYSVMFWVSDGYVNVSEVVSLNVLRPSSSLILSVDSPPLDAIMSDAFVWLNVSTDVDAACYYREDEICTYVNPPVLNESQCSASLRFNMFSVTNGKAHLQLINATKEGNYNFYVLCNNSWASNSTLVHFGRLNEPVIGVDLAMREVVMRNKTLLKKGQGVEFWALFERRGFLFSRPHIALYIDSVLVNETDEKYALQPAEMSNRFIGIWNATPGFHKALIEIDPLHVINETDEGNNVAEIEFFVSGEEYIARPDLAPGGILPRVIGSERKISNSSDFYPGEAIFFDVSIENIGDSGTGVFNIKWFLDGVQSGYGSHRGVGTGVVDGDGNSQFVWTAIAGEHRLVFVVDADNHVRESNEGNNEVAYMFNVSELSHLPDASLPDLIPTAIVPMVRGKVLTENDSIVGGETVFFDSGILNAGGAGTGVFNIKWFLDGVQSGYGSHRGVGTGVVDGDGNSQFVWTAIAGEHRLVFVVDADNHVRESNEGNNEVAYMFKRIPETHSKV